MSDHIRIEPATGTWVVRAAGAVIAETRNAKVLREGDYPPVTYFPPEDVEMAFFEPSAKSTHCPHKGDAAYHTFVGKSGRLEDVAWSYPDPLPQAEGIRGHLAFYADRVTVEEL